MNARMKLITLLLLQQLSLLCRIHIINLRVFQTEVRLFMYNKRVRALTEMYSGSRSSFLNSATVVSVLCQPFRASQLVQSTSPSICCIQHTLDHRLIIFHFDWPSSCSSYFMKESNLAVPILISFSAFFDSSVYFQVQYIYSYMFEDRQASAQLRGLSRLTRPSRINRTHSRQARQIRTGLELSIKSKAKGVAELRNKPRRWE